MRERTACFIFFLLACCLYLFTHLVQLENYPIYFFSDEAIQAVKAEQLMENGFKDEEKFLPVLMRRFDHYNLGITVYLHMPAVLLFGKKIWAVRATTVLATFLGGVALSMLLKQVCMVKNYWVGLLYLAATPLFFLHARTGFEAPIGTSFYAGFLYFYFLYRTKKPAFLIPAIICAALSFYSVPGMWLTIISSLFLFFLIDFSYHKQHMTVSGLSGVLAVLLFLPFLMLSMQEPDMFKEELHIYDSYLVKDIPVSTKITRGIENYLSVNNPLFLFFYSDEYLKNYGQRHMLKGYGQFPAWSLPLVLLGLLYLLTYLKEKPLKRLVIISLMTAPLGSLVSGFSATRNMQMVIPTTILFALGVKAGEVLIENISKRHILANIFSSGLFLFMSFLLLQTTYDALKNGPTWFQEYGLYGMQYGAKQLFSEINRSLDEYAFVVASPDFANASDVYIPFFIQKEQQASVSFRSIKDFTKERLPTRDTVLFAIPAEYAALVSSTMFQEIRVKKIIYAPDGSVAFYKLELVYKSPYVTTGSPYDE